MSPTSDPDRAPRKPPRLRAGRHGRRRRARRAAGRTGASSSAASPRLEAWGLRVKLGRPRQRPPRLHGRPRRGPGRGPPRAARATRRSAAIVCLQGGYGTPRLIPLLDEAAFAANPKILCGYSDITTLHLAQARWGDVISFYSNGVAGHRRRRRSPSSRRRSLRRALFSDEPFGPIGPNPDDPYVRTVVGGRATGRLAGGCAGLISSADRDPAPARLPGPDRRPRGDRARGLLVRRLRHPPPERRAVRRRRGDRHRRHQDEVVRRDRRAVGRGHRRGGPRAARTAADLRPADRPRQAPRDGPARRAGDARRRRRHARRRGGRDRRLSRAARLPAHRAILPCSTHGAVPFSRRTFEPGRSRGRPTRAERGSHEEENVDANAPARPRRPGGRCGRPRPRDDGSRRGAGRRGRPGGPHRRDDPGPRRLEPVQHRARRRLRGVPAHLRPAGRVRQGRQAGARASRTRWERSPDKRDVPHPRRDEVVRRDAGDLEGRLLLVGPRDGRDQGRHEHRLRLPRPGRQGRRRHEDRVPRRRDVRRLHDRPVRPDLPGLRADPAEAHLGQVRLQDDRRRRSSTPPLVGTGPYTARRVEDRPVRAVRPQPELLGQARASRTRSSSSSSPTRPTPWSRRSSRASSTTPTTSTPTSSSRSQADPAYTAVAGKANGWTPARVQHLRHRHRQDDQGRRPVDHRRCSIPPFRDALGYAVDHQALVDRVLGGYGDVGHDDRARRSCPTGTSSPTIRAPSTSSSPSRSSTPPATRSTRTASASTRRASRSSSGSSTRTRTTATRSPRSS